MTDVTELGRKQFVCRDLSTSCLTYLVRNLKCLSKSPQTAIKSQDSETKNRPKIASTDNLPGSFALLPTVWYLFFVVCLPS